MNVTITAPPLPTNWIGNPQQLLEWFVNNIEVAVDGSSFVVSDTQPQGNQGPWLKNGTQWWVWDVDTSTYIPLDLSASVTDEIYIGDIADGPPDSSTYSLWFQTNGSAVNGLFWYAGGTSGWVTQPAELVDGAVTIPMLAPQATGSLITFDNNKNPLLLALGPAGAFLQSTGGGLQWSSIFTVHGTPTFITPITVASGSAVTGDSSTWVTLSGFEAHGVPLTASALILQVTGQTYNADNGQINSRPTSSGLATPGYRLLSIGTANSVTAQAGAQATIPFALQGGSISIDYQVIGMNDAQYSIALVGYVT